MPMLLRHTGHAHVHVVVIHIVLAAINMLASSLPHCRITGLAHVDTYGHAPVDVVVMLIVLAINMLSLSLSHRRITARPAVTHTGHAHVHAIVIVIVLGINMLSWY